MDERFADLDEQKGPKTAATPAGVNRIDMAEEGPGMARASTPAGGANHDPAVEHEETPAFGEPGEVVTPPGRSTPVPGEDPADTR